jgi:tetratricopeptide (TPR) repeat protein
MKIAVAAGVAVALGVGLLFGGVFSGSSSKPVLPSPAPARLVIAGHDARAAIDRLLQGFSTGDTAAFARTLEQNVAKNPYDVDSLTLLGLTYQQRARETGDPAYLSLSERALRRAVTIDRQEPLAVTGLASLAVVRHRFNDALALAREALTIDPEDASARAALGDALLNLGRYDEAFRELDKAAEQSPGVATYARISYARELLGRPDGAIEVIREALEVGQAIPEYDAWTRVQIGNLYFNTGRLRLAEAAYRRALERLPGYVHAEAGLARVEAARGQYGDAAARLRKALEVLPVPQYAILLGDVLEAAGQKQEADDAYALVDAIQRLLVANGVRTELQTALFDLDHDHDVAGALARATEAYEAAPSISAADALAWALYKNGRCDEARRYSENALRLGTLDALMFFHRGMIEKCLGNTTAAQSFALKARETNPHFSLLYAPVVEELVA